MYTSSSTSNTVPSDSSESECRGGARGGPLAAARGIGMHAPLHASMQLHDSIGFTCQVSLSGGKEMNDAHGA